MTNKKTSFLIVSDYCFQWTPVNQSHKRNPPSAFHPENKVDEPAITFSNVFFLNNYKIDRISHFYYLTFLNFPMGCKPSAIVSISDINTFSDNFYFIVM